MKYSTARSYSGNTLLYEFTFRQSIRVSMSRQTLDSCSVDSVLHGMRNHTNDFQLQKYSRKYLLNVFINKLCDHIYEIFYDHIYEKFCCTAISLKNKWKKKTINLKKYLKNHMGKLYIINLLCRTRLVFLFNSINNMRAGILTPVHFLFMYSYSCFFFFTFSLLGRSEIK